MVSTDSFPIASKCGDGHGNRLISSRMEFMEFIRGHRLFKGFSSLVRPTGSPTQPMAHTVKLSLDVAVLISLRISLRGQELCTHCMLLLAQLISLVLYIPHCVHLLARLQSWHPAV